MEQRAQEQQLELLIDGRRGHATGFDATTRTEIVNLSKALLGDRLDWSRRRRRRTMTKITSDHLARKAYVYVRRWCTT